MSEAPNKVEVFIVFVKTRKSDCSFGRVKGLLESFILIVFVVFV